MTQIVQANCDCGAQQSCDRCRPTPAKQAEFKAWSRRPTETRYYSDEVLETALKSVSYSNDTEYDLGREAILANEVRVLRQELAQSEARPSRAKLRYLKDENHRLREELAKTSESADRYYKRLAEKSDECGTLKVTIARVEQTVDEIWAPFEKFKGGNVRNTYLGIVRKLRAALRGTA